MTRRLVLTCEAALGGGEDVGVHVGHESVVAVGDEVGHGVEPHHAALPYDTE